MLLSAFVQQLYTYYQAIDAVYSINQLLALYFLFSVLGWILETLYRSVSNRRFYNPGFLKGPIVPLYGNAVLFIMITIIFTQNETVFVRLLIYFAAITMMEFVTGEVMLRLFKRRYWDYTDNVLNVRGHICLPFSIAWAVLSLLFEKTIYPLSMLLVGQIDDQTLLLINAAGIIIIQVDFIYSIGIWNPKQLVKIFRNSGNRIRQVTPVISNRYLTDVSGLLKIRLPNLTYSRHYFSWVKKWKKR